jgi:hypothetical protein
VRLVSGAWNPGYGRNLAVVTARRSGNHLDPLKSDEGHHCSWRVQSFSAISYNPYF